MKFALGFATFATFATIAVLSIPVTVFAQAASDATSMTNKQAAKAQRKADRKAHRAKTNAELGALEKNGYQPGGEQTNYPQNLQNAQAKVNAQKGAMPAAASAP